MKKKGLLTVLGSVCLALVLAALLLPACAKPAPPAPAPAPVTPAPAPAPVTPAPAPAPVTPTAPEIKPVTLVLQDNAPPAGARSVAVQWWMDEVTKRSDGKITFDVYWSQSLIPVKETLPAVSTGLADVGMITTTYFSSVLPLHDIGNIPLGPASDRAGVRAFADLYEEFPEMRAELTRQGVKVLFTSGMPPMQLHFAKKPVRKLEDMKGLKVRSYGVSAGKILKAFGAVPVAMPFPEIYEALKLGTIDGTVSYIYAARPYRHYEVAKYYVVCNIGALSGCEPFIINLKTWESLGLAAQKILQEVAREAQDLLNDLHDEEDVSCIELMREAGVDIYVLPSEERAEWVKKGRFVWDEWAKEIDAKGLPGTEIAAFYLELAEKYQKEIEAKK